jgi:hypothetical protein
MVFYSSNSALRKLLLVLHHVPLSFPTACSTSSFLTIFRHLSATAKAAQLSMPSNDIEPDMPLKHTGPAGQGPVVRAEPPLNAHESDVLGTTSRDEDAANFNVDATDCSGDHATPISDPGSQIRCSTTGFHRRSHERPCRCSASARPAAKCSAWNH